MTQMTTTNIVYISAEAIVGAITVVGNVVVLIAIWRTKRLHTITNVFISNLAAADIAVGVFVGPSAALSYLGLPQNVYGCIFINCAILMFTNVSILMLLTIACERFFAIRFPFIYERHVTIKVAIWTNLCVWILGLVLGMVPMYGWNKAPDKISFCAFTGVITMEYMVYFQFFGLVLVPLVIMLFIYIYILIIVRQHARHTRALTSQFGHQQSRFDKDVKAAKLFALLFFLFGLFWLPVNILNSITLFCPSCQGPFELLLTAIVLSHANSTVNPFLYATSNSRIKGAIKVMFRMKLSVEEMESLESTKTVATIRPVLANEIDKWSVSFTFNQPQETDLTDFTTPSNTSDTNYKDVNSTGVVSFVEIPEILEENQIASSHNNMPDSVQSQNIQNSNIKTNGQRLSHHFLRDDLDGWDSLVPVDGIMANIYESLDEDMRDIILNKGDKSNHAHIWRRSECSRERDKAVAKMTLSSNTSSPRGSGRSNPSFVSDECQDDISKYLGRDSNFERTNDELTQALEFDRSPHTMLSRGAPSVSMQQESTFHGTSDNNVSLSPAASVETQIAKVSPSHSSELALTPSRLMPHTIERSPHDMLLSPSSTDVQCTSRNHIVMESEMDDVMSVKLFHDSQERDATISYSNPDFDERGILRNKCTQRTKL